MRIEQSFQVAAPPERVFDYVADSSNLASWQTTKTSVEQLTDGPPGLGTRVRERTKPPGGKEFEQVVEFTEFERVGFVADGPLRGLMRLGEPLLKRVMARQFAGYHDKLRHNVEAG